MFQTSGNRSCGNHAARFVPEQTLNLASPTQRRDVWHRALLGRGKATVSKEGSPERTRGSREPEPLQVPLHAGEQVAAAHLARGPAGASSLSGLSRLCAGALLKPCLKKKKKRERHM